LSTAGSTFFYSITGAETLLALLSASLNAERAFSSSYIINTSRFPSTVLVLIVYIGPFYFTKVTLCFLMISMTSSSSML
jgi:hypothetical protein